MFPTPQVPRSFLTPRQRSEVDEVHSSNEVAIRVLHKQRGTDSVWSLETLEEKVLTMRDMYERMEEGDDSLLLVSGVGINWSKFRRPLDRMQCMYSNIGKLCVYTSVGRESGPGSIL